MNKRILAIVILIIALVSFGAWVASLHQNLPLQTQSAAAKQISPQIIASGTTTAQNTATIHFQAGGKMVGLYAKEGDKVYAGQTIAQLDTYTLQQQLAAALNTYRATRDTFEQTQNNYGINSTSNVISNDTVKRILDQNQVSLDNSVTSVALANYALQLATLTSPINGVITHEDVNVANINVTPTTIFVVSDPSTLVFRAQVPQYQIDYVHVGSAATITLDGVSGRKFPGTITKIYPQKVTLASGQQVYNVDVTSDGLLQNATFDQPGSVTITSDVQQGVFLVPAWSVIGHQYIWVVDNGQPMLKKVVIGNEHGNDVEIKSGLTIHDAIITNPEAVVTKKYTLL